MAIATAVVNGRQIEIYDHARQCTGWIHLHPQERLWGYTNENVSILSGQQVRIYTSNAKLLFSVYTGTVWKDDWQAST